MLFNRHCPAMNRSLLVATAVLTYYVAATLESEEAKTPLETMTDVTNEFGVCVLQLLASPRVNTVFSPYGLMSVSLIVYEGATGTTAAQFHNTLHLPWHRDVTRLGFRDLHRYIRSYFTSDGFLRGLILSQSQITFRPSYSKILRFYGFDSPSKTAITEPAAMVTTKPMSPATTKPLPPTKPMTPAATKPLPPTTTTPAVTTTITTETTTVTTTAETSEGSTTLAAVTEPATVTPTAETAVSTQTETSEGSTTLAAVTEPATESTVSETSTTVATAVAATTGAAPTTNTGDEITDNSELKTTRMVAATNVTTQESSEATLPQTTSAATTTTERTTTEHAAALTATETKSPESTAAETTTVAETASLLVSTPESTVAPPAETTTVAETASLLVSTSESTVAPPAETTTVAETASLLVSTSESTVAPPAVTTTVAETASLLVSTPESTVIPVVTPPVETTTVTETVQPPSTSESTVVLVVTETLQPPSTSESTVVPIFTETAQPPSTPESTVVPVVTPPTETTTSTALRETVTQRSTALNEVTTGLPVVNIETTTNAITRPTEESTEPVTGESVSPEKMIMTPLANSTTETTAGTNESSTDSEQTTPDEVTFTFLPSTVLFNTITDSNLEITRTPTTVDLAQLLTMTISGFTPPPTATGAQGFVDVSTTTLVNERITTNTIDEGGLPGFQTVTMVDPFVMIQEMSATLPQGTAFAFTDDTTKIKRTTAAGDNSSPGMITFTTKSVSDSAVAESLSNTDTVNRPETPDGTMGVTHTDTSDATVPVNTTSGDGNSTIETTESSLPSTPAAVTVDSDAIIFPDQSRRPRSLYGYSPNTKLANWVVPSHGAGWYRNPVEQWFWTYSGDKLVPVLTYTAYLPFARVPSIGATALQLPLDDPRYSLLVVLPNNNRGFKNLLYTLQWCPIRSIIYSLKLTPVYAVIPMFTISKQINLIPALLRLGIRDVFDPYRSNLSEMSSEPNLYVRNVQQVISISVRKYFYTNRWFESSPSQIDQHFLATHPFAFFVIDEETKVALIAGTVVDPSH